MVAQLVDLFGHQLPLKDRMEMQFWLLDAHDVFVKDSGSGS